MDEPVGDESDCKRQPERGRLREWSGVACEPDRRCLRFAARPARCLLARLPLRRTRSSAFAVSSRPGFYTTDSPNQRSISSSTTPAGFSRSDWKTGSDATQTSRSRSPQRLWYSDYALDQQEPVSASLIVVELEIERDFGLLCV